MIECRWEGCRLSHRAGFYRSICTSLIDDDLNVQGGLDEDSLLMEGLM